jgi:hypothetical protein
MALFLYEKSKKVKIISVYIEVEFSGSKKMAGGKIWVNISSGITMDSTNMDEKKSKSLVHNETTYTIFIYL